MSHGAKANSQHLPVIYHHPPSLGGLAAQWAPPCTGLPSPRATSETVCGPHPSHSLVQLSKLSMLRLPSPSCKKKGPLCAGYLLCSRCCAESFTYSTTVTYTPWEQALLLNQWAMWGSRVTRLKLEVTGFESRLWDCQSTVGPCSMLPLPARSFVLYPSALRQGTPYSLSHQPRPRNGLH